MNVIFLSVKFTKELMSQFLWQLPVVIEASHEVYFQPSTLSVVGKGFYGVHDQGDLSFGVTSVTVCQAGSPITCVPQDHNVTSGGIIRTQNGDGACLKKK